MKDIDLKNIYSISLKLFTIIKEEYNIYLSEEKKKILDELDIFKFYKEIKGKKYPFIQFIDDKCYLNSSYDINYIEYLPFICLAVLCGNLNPLKIGLIEEELMILKDKYALTYTNKHEKESEVANIVNKTILNDIPYKVIFLDSDTEIVSYLVEEKGSKIAILYSEISKKMKNKKKNEDYSDVLDYLYEYLSSKIR